jgi:hypothetical protein
MRTTIRIAIVMVLLSPMRFAFPQAHAADSSTAWEDEPGWDCFSVVKNYKVGPPTNRGELVFIPVASLLIGQYCNDFALLRRLSKKQSVTNWAE